MKKGVIVIGVIIIFLALGIYLNTKTNDSNINETQNQNSQTADYNIEIKSFAFSPSELKISVGETVKWTNYDSVKHTVTSDTGNELDSQLLSKEEIYSHTFNTKGIYEYHCTPHPSMKGKIIVE
jgi:amicyanin